MIQMHPVESVYIITNVVLFGHILERLARLKEVEDKTNEKKEELKAKLTLTVQLLADAYDR